MYFATFAYHTIMLNQKAQIRNKLDPLRASPIPQVGIRESRLILSEHSTSRFQGDKNPPCGKAAGSEASANGVENIEEGIRTLPNSRLATAFIRSSDLILICIELDCIQDLDFSGRYSPL